MPVFGMCYGFQAMVQALGGTVAHTGRGEYGHTPVRLRDTASTLFDGQPAEQSVWMSHGDSVTVAPEGMTVTASTEGAPVAAFEDDERRLYGVQWHPEVRHSAYGQRVLEHFLWTRRRDRADLDAGQRRRRPGRRRCARRSGRARRCARCPAASTRRWRPRWCSVRSGTS